MMFARLLRSLFGRFPAGSGYRAEAWTKRGNALRDARRYEDALDAYARALRHGPDRSRTHFHRGNALMEMGRLQEALADYRRAVQLEPGYVHALYNISLVLQRLKRLDEALAGYDHVLRLAPGDAEAHNNRGIVLSELRRHEEALASYDQALSHRPGYVDALHNRALALTNLKRPDEAARSLECMLALAPGHPFAEGRLLHARMLSCDWDGLEAAAGRVRRGIEDGKQVTDPFSFHAISDSMREIARCAGIYAAATHPDPVVRLWNAERYDHSRIRLGYVSGEFRQHATAFLMAQLFERHGRDRFELFAFDNGWDDGSEVRSRINRTFDEVVDINGMADLDAAAAIRQRRIDLLIDLNGYCGRDQQGIFSCRPCPVQVGYLGWPGTTGAGYMDYILADPHVLPAAHAAYYSERVVYLPDTYQVNDAGRSIAPRVPTRAQAALPEAGFVFCCFNNNYKITPEIFDIWMRLLHEIGGSVLWLLEDNPAASRNLRREAERRGIAAARLVFAHRAEPPEHLARHRLADLFLDTLPYNAHTTASDALWAGLPLLTCMGNTFQGRVAGSLLHAAGLPELITYSLQDYEALALELARSPSLLAGLRARLECNRSTCALFDTDRFRRHIESAYITMWERYQRGEPPKGFTVQAVQQAVQASPDARRPAARLSRKLN